VVASVSAEMGWVEEALVVSSPLSQPASASAAISPTIRSLPAMTESLNNRLDGSTGARDSS
jgi:hypothetical protein